MKFYIVTPTFNSLSWLQRCMRSVADQAGEGVDIHHHVQDGGSEDGTPGWLEKWQKEHAATPGYVFTYESRKDAGMYDAINCAWDKMPSDADVTAHLNSDEQYLPGAMKGVAEAFEARPEAEIVLGTYIILDANSRYICHRRPVYPACWRSQTVCEVITCSCFHRVDAFLRHGIRFNLGYRALADMIFFREIAQQNLRICVRPQLITSSFTVTGDNLAWSDLSQREWDGEIISLPWYVSRRHIIAYRISNLLRRLTDLFYRAPFVYSIYTDSSALRREYRIKKPTSRWGMRTVSHEMR